MKKIDTLIISGASLTSSPWFTWADIVTEILQPRTVINLSARGTGNYYIVLSCLKALTETKSKSVVCMPMFTTIDKFDMYIPADKILSYLEQKHRPWQLTATPAQKNTAGFWSTGSHWPEVKKLFYDNFFDTSVSTVNTILLFHNLETYCKEHNVDLIPLFDSNIWNLLECDLNSYVTGTPLPNRHFLDNNFVKSFEQLLPSNYKEFTSLINYAIDNNLEFYNQLNKMHPPSSVHLKWTNNIILPILEKKFDCSQLSTGFLNKIENLSKEW